MGWRWMRLRSRGSTRLMVSFFRIITRSWPCRGAVVPSAWQTAWASPAPSPCVGKPLPHQPALPQLRGQLSSSLALPSYHSLVWGPPRHPGTVPREPPCQTHLLYTWDHWMDALCRVDSTNCSPPAWSSLSNSGPEVGPCLAAQSQALTSPWFSAEPWPLLLESCWMQLLTAMLLLPGARSSSGISTQPRERTAKH